MVINYKELNKYSIFYGYFLPNKNTLINLAKGKNISLNLIVNQVFGK